MLGSRAGIDLLLQVLDLALQGIDIAGRLPTEGIELLHRSATARGGRAVV